MPYLTAEEVVSRWTGADAPNITDPVLATLIADAETYTDWKFPTLNARILAGDPPLRIVQMVLSTVIQRAYLSTKNGLSQYSYTSGPFSESGSYSGDTDRKGTIYFTQDEIAMLGASNLPGAAFKINLDIHPSNAGAHPLPYANYSPYPYLPGDIRDQR